MKAGTRSSLQSHRHKLETLLVLDGAVHLEIVDPTGHAVHEAYAANQAYTIRPGIVHRVTVLADCRLIEVSTPELDDVVRHQDDYGRQ